MAEPKEQEFLDDIADVEAEQDADEMIDIDEAAAELDEIDALRAERDEYKDRFMRALADAENSRKRADKDRKGPAREEGPYVLPEWCGFRPRVCRRCYCRR